MASSEVDIEEIAAELLRGAVASIRMTAKAEAEFRDATTGNDALTVVRRKHLERSFREFCDVHPHRLPPEKFKKEGDFRDQQGGMVPIFAFKARKWRLYGTITQYGGLKCFIGVAVDSAKKQDRANPEILKTAARVAGKQLRKIGANVGKKT
jgi:hypothetical protein